MNRSEDLFHRAVRVIPGGVNSPVRAFGSVGLNPRYIASADREWITDVDGNRYIDYIGSWGPMILGHNHPEVLRAAVSAAEKGLSFGACCPDEVEMAELICSMVPSIEQVRMVNSGTEAVMSAIRAARGYTGKDKIIKFEGCYHGHCDAMLVKAGSGLMTSGVPGSAGVPEGCVSDTLTAVYNQIESVKELFAAYPGQIAAVIIEPVAANMGVVVPKEGFLKELEALCKKEQALLIFDEVITGFRLGPGGAQEKYGITPDLTTFGKIIGAGMPVGAYGGKREIMQMVSPVGTVYQAGTLSGNPVAMAAGLAQLRILKAHPELYTQMDQLGDYFRTRLSGILDQTKAGCLVTGTGSLSCLYFTDQEVTDYQTAQLSDTGRFAEYFAHMLSHGSYLAPSQFEAIFISSVHTKEDVDATLAAMEAFFEEEAKCR